MDTKIAILPAMTILPTLAGYLARRSNLVPERIGQHIMTLVLVTGYSTVGFLSIWGLQIKLNYIWLPALAAVHMVIMAVLGRLFAPTVTKDFSQTGLLSLCSAMGNNGFTMGGFVIYLLYGAEGLGLMGILTLMCTPMTVFLIYPIARHFAGDGKRPELAKLMVKSLFDWRSIGLPFAVTAVILSANGVQRPAIISELKIIDICVYVITAMAYFAIGLRLHLASLARLKNQVIWLAFMRFAVAAAVGWALAFITDLTPWALSEVSRNSFIVEMFVPMAVTIVGVANMFNLRPKEASLQFVINTLIYLVLILPLVFVIYGK